MLGLEKMAQIADKNGEMKSKNEREKRMVNQKLKITPFDLEFDSGSNGVICVL